MFVDKPSHRWSINFMSVHRTILNLVLITVVQMMKLRRIFSGDLINKNPSMESVGNAIKLFTAVSYDFS